jgi:HPt (histidine-containing phosphotransfer) domain-containing protein
MSSLPVVDQEAIENLRALSPGDDDVFLKEILVIFLEDTPLRIADLHSSLAAGNTESFVRAAHSLKGSSSNVGAAQMRAAAEILEHHSRKQGLSDVKDLIAQLESAYARAREALQKLLAP